MAQGFNNVGPASQTMVQRSTNIGSVCHTDWDYTPVRTMTQRWVHVNPQSDMLSQHKTQSGCYHHIRNSDGIFVLHKSKSTTTGPSLGGGGFERVARPPPLTPPPPATTKLKIYPSNILQNPPYCTNLQLKIKQNLQGACPLTLLTCVSSTPNINSGSILLGVQLTYFENTPAIQNSIPPLKHK